MFYSELGNVRKMLILIFFSKSKAGTMTRGHDVTLV